MKYSTVLTALLATGALAQVFPAPDGPYKVQWINQELIDKSRPDPFNATHPRRMMVSNFLPIPSAQCKKICKVPYMPPAIAEIEDQILNDYLSDIGWPGGVLAKLEMEVCCEVKGKLKDKFPTVLFGTGLNTTRLFYSATAQHLASKGYNIIVMDHPYETDVVQFPSGEIIYGGKIGRSPNDTKAIEFGLDVRTADVSFLLTKLNIRRTVYMGQSYGGAAAAAAMLSEKRILGGSNLDGILWGRVQDVGVSRPFLTFGAVGHNSTTEPSWKSFFNATKPGVWNREISVAESVHGSFCDFSLIGDVTGLRGNKDLVEWFFGPALGSRVMKIMRAYLGDYFDFILKRGDGGLLKGESPEFPDVEFIR